MLFKVGDIVRYNFINLNNIYEKAELGQILILNHSTCVVNFIVYKKERLINTILPEPMNTMQEISYTYLSLDNINAFINNIDTNNYIIELDNLINVSDTKFKYKYGEPRMIPLNSNDAITYEDIKNGDILVDFIRIDNKTEYYYNTYYKESTMKHILETMKNPFTNTTIDLNSIVIYHAILI
jgi:hypothetical protein